MRPRETGRQNLRIYEKDADVCPGADPCPVAGRLRHAPGGGAESGPCRVRLRAARPLPAPGRWRPPGSYAPWQEAYAEFLKDLRTAEYRYKLGELTCPGDDKPVEVYSLYDVDKDGVPELFLKRGACEADFSTQVYTFRDGQISGLGSFSSGHSGLYTVPEEKAVLVWYSHMGYGDIEKFVVTDGNSFVHGETLLSEDEDDTRWDGYTVPGEVVPGSQSIPSYYIGTRFRSVDSPALVLPVFDFQGREFPAPMEEAKVRTMVDQVLHQNRPFWGVSGEGFDGDTGLITWTEYLQPGSAYRYGKAAPGGKRAGLDRCKR